MIFYYYRFISLNSINSNTKRAKKKEKTIEPKLNSTESVIQCVCHARNDNGKLSCMFGINLKWESKQETTNNVTKRKCSVCTSNILRVLQKLPSSKPKAKKTTTTIPKTILCLSAYKKYTDRFRARRDKSIGGC